ncbi:MAG: hypothetical protein Q9227_004397 [Pyrenula ochraceoflavens]
MAGRRLQEHRSETHGNSNNTSNQSSTPRRSQRRIANGSIGVPQLTTSSDNSQHLEENDGMNRQGLMSYHQRGGEQSMSRPTSRLENVLLRRTTELEGQNAELYEHIDTLYQDMGELYQQLEIIKKERDYYQQRALNAETQPLRDMNGQARSNDHGMRSSSYSQIQQGTPSRAMAGPSRNTSIDLGPIARPNLSESSNLPKSMSSVEFRTRPSQSVPRTASATDMNDMNINSLAHLDHEDEDNEDAQGVQLTARRLSSRNNA